MHRLLEAKQKQIEMQDVQIKAIKEKNISLLQQLEVLKLKVSPKFPHNLILPLTCVIICVDFKILI